MPEVDAAKLCCKVKVTFTVLFFGFCFLFHFLGGISLYHSIKSLENNQTLKPGTLPPSLWQAWQKNFIRDEQEVTCGRLPVVSWKFRGTFLKIEPSLDCKACRFGTGLYKASKTPYSITLTHSLSSAPMLRQTAPLVVKSESQMY